MKEKIDFQWNFRNSEKIALENFYFHTVLSELFYKTCYTSKLIDFFVSKNYLIVYTLSFEIKAMLFFVKKNVGTSLNNLLLINNFLESHGIEILAFKQEQKTNTGNNSEIDHIFYNIIR